MFMFIANLRMVYSQFFCRKNAVKNSKNMGGRGVTGHLDFPKNIHFWNASRP